MKTIFKLLTLSFTLASLSLTGMGNNTTVASDKNIVKIDINERDSNGETALVRAAREGNLDKVIKLLANGANPNLVNALELSALIYSVFKRHIACTHALIKANADVNWQTPAGTTALMVAVRNDDAIVVEVLLEAGANTNLRNKENYTALMIARQRGNREVSALIECYEKKKLV